MDVMIPDKSSFGLKISYIYGIFFNMTSTLILNSAARQSYNLGLSNMGNKNAALYIQNNIKQTAINTEIKTLSPFNLLIKIYHILMG